MCPNSQRDKCIWILQSYRRIHRHFGTVRLHIHQCLFHSLVLLYIWCHTSIASQTMYLFHGAQICRMQNAQFTTRNSTMKRKEKWKQQIRKCEEKKMSTDWKITTKEYDLSSETVNSLRIKKGHSERKRKTAVNRINKCKKSLIQIKR